MEKRHAVYTKKPGLAIASLGKVSHVTACRESYSAHTTIAFPCRSSYYKTMNESFTSSHPSGRHRRKLEVQKLLTTRDLPGIVKWVSAAKNPLTVLSSLLFSTDKLHCWRVIEAIGLVAKRIAADDIEQIRKLVRHNFWMMNDESGNIGWRAPETIGEILYNLPALIEEYGPMLPSFLDEEPFERGTHWAVARVASKRTDIFTNCIERLKKSLDDPDPYIRGYTLLAFDYLKNSSVTDKIKAMSSDNNSIEIYDFESGHLRQVTVGLLAKQISK